MCVRVCWVVWSVGECGGMWGSVWGGGEVGSVSERTSQEESGGGGQSRGGQYGKETMNAWLNAARHRVFHKRRRHPTQLFLYHP